MGRNIAKNTTKTFTLSTGNTPATSMPIIVGKDAYFVTPYVPGMDLGTHFSVIINADFDMTKIDTIMQTGSFYIGMGGHNLYAEIDEPDNERDFELPNVTTGVDTLILSGDGSHYRFSLDSPGDPDYQTQSVTETTGVLNRVRRGIGIVPTAHLITPCLTSIQFKYKSHQRILVVIQLPL